MFTKETTFIYTICHIYYINYTQIDLFHWYLYLSNALLLNKLTRREGIASNTSEKLTYEKNDWIYQGLNISWYGPTVSGSSAA